MFWVRHELIFTHQKLALVLKGHYIQSQVLDIIYKANIQQSVREERQAKQGGSSGLKQQLGGRPRMALFVVWLRLAK